MIKARLCWVFARRENRQKNISKRKMFSLLIILRSVFIFLMQAAAGSLGGSVGDLTVADEDKFLYAVATGDVQAMELLLARGMKVNALYEFNGHRFYPLKLACAAEQLHSVHRLLNAGADVDERKDGISALHIASQNGHHQVVELLIKAQADVNLPQIDGVTPLLIASQMGHQQVVESLIKAHADVNVQHTDRCSPLYISSQFGHLQIVESLIKAQADVNLQKTDGCSPLYIASQNGHQKVMELLIKAEADVNLQDISGCSPLYIASQNGNLKVVESLVKAQADVNLQKIDGRSPLFIASYGGQHQVVDSLIKAKADVNVIRDTGESPLYLASYNGHQQIVKSLIKAQADVNLQRVDGCSPLYAASQNVHQQVVESLIKAQADVNLQKTDGCSPLYIASYNGHHKVVESLIKAQADVGLLRKTGESPLDVASQKGHQQVAELLKKAQADVTSLTIEISSTVSNSPKDDSSASDKKMLIPTDSELSTLLHSKLCLSGFVDSRAALQSAAADALQEILRRRLQFEIFVVGSFSDGWGNSLKTLDGRPDIESDIDVMSLIPGRLYHIRDQSSNPARPSPGCALRPDLDDVPASRLCGYPPLAPLQPHRISASNITESTLEALRQDVASTASPCHVVHANSPGQVGKELRVSTSFLERRMLRSLNTLQGQLFVTLKYLVKKVICPKGGSVEGLKPYHAKTIVFRMLEETPAEQWNSKNLVSLVRQSLQMLLGCVESNLIPGNADGKIIEHFFLIDAALYLKGVDRKHSSETLCRIADRLKAEIERLPESLVQFADSLKPVSGSGRFYFHPFQILPDLRPMPLPQASSRLEYHQIYDVVRECILRLSRGNCSGQSQVSLTELIARLPDCAFTTREALRALACLKFGSRESVEKVLRHCGGREVSRGVDLAPQMSKAEVSSEIVWRHLESQDSAWKFCFDFDQPPEFCFVLAASMKCFPLRMKNGLFYINFDALLWALRLQLSTDWSAASQDWIRNVAHRDDTDEQELMVAVCHSTDQMEACVLLAKLGTWPNWLWNDLIRRLSMKN